MSYSTVNLQATLASASSPLDSPEILHHPIGCRDKLLWLDEDGRFGCEHAEAPPGDVRTQYCIDHSIAILLMEMLAVWTSDKGRG